MAGPDFGTDVNIDPGNLYINGNVGVRTSSPPRGMLAIHDVTNDRSDHLYLSSSADQNNGYRIGRQPDGRLEFEGYQGTHSGFRFILPTGTALTVDPNGNVGIGTPSPGAKLHVAGNIRADGNLWVLRSVGDPIPLIYLGRADMINVPGSGDIPAHTNYFFWQSRFNRDGWYWSGWNTFRAPGTVKGGPNSGGTVARGYGYYPFRNMAKNYLFEASGALITKQYVVAPQVYLQLAQHLDLVDGQSKIPDGYDSFDHPYIFLRRPDNSIVETPLTANIDEADNGPITINVQSTTDFISDDEVFISDTSDDPATCTGGGALRGEINEIQSVNPPNQMVLKRGSSKFCYQNNGKVQRVRELGGVRIPPLGTPRIVLEGTEIGFYDGQVAAGKRLARLVTSVVNNVKVDSGENAPSGEVTDANQTPTPYTMPANSTADLGTINLHASFSSPFQYRVILTPRNRLNSWGVSLTVQDRSTNSFTVLGRNDHPTLTAEFYIQWLAIGT